MHARTLWLAPFVLALVFTASAWAEEQDYFLDSVAGGTITVIQDISFKLGQQQVDNEWAHLRLRVPATHEGVLKAGSRAITIKKATPDPKNLTNRFPFVDLELESPTLERVRVYTTEGKSVLVSDFKKYIGGKLLLDVGPNAKKFPAVIEPNR